MTKSDMEELETFKVIDKDEEERGGNRDVVDYDDDDDDDNDESLNMNRDTWNGEFEFVLSLIGYTVGLSNIWRFPYYCYRNGGGIAIIPFVAFILIAGGPLYYIEVCLGQFSGRSPVGVWNICPLFKGIGVVMVLAASVYTWEFGQALSWVLYYLVQSFNPTLPWSTCGHSWNTEYCLDHYTNKTESNATTMTPTDTNSTKMNSTFKTAANEFWERNVLGLSDGLEDMGSVQLHLVGCLFLAWVLIFACLCRGVKSLGKVVYVTSTLPYILLTVLLVRSVTLDGAWDGLKIYLLPEWGRLATGQIWIEAAIQCFFSLGPAWGGVVTMASFNKFHHSALRDTLIVCVLDAFTAIYGGIIVFSALGFLSKQTDTPLDQLPFSGAGLAFVAYPEVLSRLPAPNVWSVLFFITLVFVGIDSVFAAFEAVSCSLIDTNYAKWGKYRTWINAALAGVFFLLTLPLCTSGGYYLFILVDWYIAPFNSTVTAFLECTVVSWIYGASRFSDDIESMTGNRPSKTLRFVWCCVVPVFMVGIFIVMCTTYSLPTIGEYNYPVYGILIGNIVAFGPLVVLVTIVVVTLFRTPGNIVKRLSTATEPSKLWTPHDLKQHQLYLHKTYHYERNWTGRVRVNMLGFN
ncbi:hypothetical protein ACF0H5_019795 [Mactra antiquata]